MKDGRGENDEMSRGVWKEMEDWKADETRVEKAGRKRRERKEETNDGGRENDSKDCGRKGK